MLQSIREKATGWIAYIIIIGISIPFAFWGIDQYFAGGTNTVAIVDSEKISNERLTLIYRDKLKELKSVMSDNPEELNLQEKILKRSVLDDLIDNTLVKNFSLENNLNVSDKILANDIQNNKFFKSKGSFDYGKYEMILQRQGLDPSMYESIRREEIRNNLFFSSIMNTSFYSTQEIENLENIKYETRDIASINLSYQDYQDFKENITEKEIKEFYEQNKSFFLKPKKYKIEYVLFEKSDFINDIEVSTEALYGFYENNIDKYTEKEQRQVKQIFIKNKNNEGFDDLETNDNADKKVSTIVEQLIEGKKFEDLVFKYSDDELSKNKNGELGWISKGDLKQDLDKEIFKTKVNNYSAPVKTPNGVYIFYIDKIKEPVIKDFNLIKKTISDDFKNFQKVKKFNEASEELSNIAFETSDSILPVAEYLNKNITETRNDVLSIISKETSVFKNELVKQELSKANVQNGTNSNIVEYESGRYVIFRIKESSENNFKEFNDVKSEIKTLIVIQNSIKKIDNKMKDYISQLNNNKSLEKLSKKLKKKIKYKKQLKRDDQSVSPDFSNTAFLLSKTKPAAFIEKSTGEYEILYLKNITAGVSDLSDKSLSNMFSLELGNTEIYSFLRNLRNSSDIVIYNDKLNN